METNYEDYFLSIQPMLNDAVSTVARRQFLSADDADDLAGEVRLKLMDNDYFLLRCFRDRSRLHTYLLVVIHRHLLDARRSKWGKWRPCRAAQRFGHVGIELDRLLTRDGLSFDAACESLCARYGRGLDRKALYDVSLRFPRRTPRHWVGAAELDRLPAEPAPDPLDANTGDISTALADAIRRCKPEDRRLIRLRFIDGRSIADIARMLRVEQKPLYRRFQSLFATLQGALAQHHVTRDAALCAIGDARHPEIADILDAVCGHGVSTRLRPLAELGRTA